MRKPGENCTVVLTARTEERLVELASLHLHEVHGTTSLSQEKVADIRKHFASRPTADVARVVDRIFEKYNCNGEPECSWRYTAEAEIILNGGKRAHTRSSRQTDDRAPRAWTDLSSAQFPLTFFNKIRPAETFPPAFHQHGAPLSCLPAEISAGKVGSRCVGRTH